MLVSLCAGSALAADETPTNLGEVVVTAQKRAEKLQDVPISMEVVSGDKLSDFNTNDFKAMFKFTPNVAVQTTAGNDVIYIRGFGSPPANFSFDQAVSLYMDGIYAGRNRQAQARCSAKTPRQAPSASCRRARPPHSRLRSRASTASISRDRKCPATSQARSARRWARAWR
jgi:hypothetical protein